MGGLGWPAVALETLLMVLVIDGDGCGECWLGVEEERHRSVLGVGTSTADPSGDETDHVVPDCA